MQRAARALKIRDQVMSASLENGRYDRTTPAAKVYVSGNRWRAMIWRRQLAQGECPAPPTEVAEFLDHCRQSHVLDLWVGDLGKMLSVESTGATTRLISMRPGDWEQDLFGLRPKSLRDGRGPKSCSVVSLPPPLLIFSPQVIAASVGSCSHNQKS